MAPPATALRACPPGGLGNPSWSSRWGSVSRPWGTTIGRWRPGTRIPARSPFAGRVAVPRAQALILNRGEFSAAEEILNSAIKSRDATAIDARQTLARLFFWQGRLREMRLLLQDGWTRAPDRATALRDYWKLDTDPIPTMAIETALARATEKAPNDDRAWLARANLATRSGRFDDALKWLDDCVRARPDDPSVWEARLDWAVAARNDDETWRALAHLSVDRVSGTDILALEASLAARRGLAEREQRALESLVAREPGHSQAMERLAVLAREAGRTDCAVKCLQDKMAIDRARERYRDLLATGVPAGKLEDLARLAETLGPDVRGSGLVDPPRGCGARQSHVSRLHSTDCGPRAASSSPIRSNLADAAPTLRPRSGTHGRVTGSGRDHGGALPRFRDDAQDRLDCRR